MDALLAAVAPSGLPTSPYPPPPIIQPSNQASSPSIDPFLENEDEDRRPPQDSPRAGRRRQRSDSLDTHGDPNDFSFDDLTDLTDLPDPDAADIPVPKTMEELWPAMVTLLGRKFIALRGELLTDGSEVAAARSAKLTFTTSQVAEVGLYVQAAFFNPELAVYRDAHLDKFLLEMMRADGINGVPAEKEITASADWQRYINKRTTQYRCTFFKLVSRIVSVIRCAKADNQMNDSLPRDSALANIGDLAIALRPKSSFTFQITLKHLERFSALRGIARLISNSDKYEPGGASFWNEVNTMAIDYAKGGPKKSPREIDAERRRFRTHFYQVEVGHGGHPTTGRLDADDIKSKVTNIWQHDFDSKIAKMGCPDQECNVRGKKAKVMHAEPTPPAPAPTSADK